MHIETKSKPVAEPIAIVGVGCRFPGAPDLPSFARLLADGRDAVTEIPADRWNREQLLHPDPRQRGKTYTLAAGVIDGVDRFDAAFFGISPREAAQMDPQQRLLLELTHEALEDAGLSGRRLAGSRTGVYVGGSSSDYLALRLGDPSVADAYFMTGATLSTLANRISYVFDFKGPSFTVDTACSSSLVALHVACSAMRRGEVDLAVVAGVNLLLAPQSFVGFSRASMLSPRGRCHSFAAGADGYVRAEGGAAVLLKPLSAALADGDRIMCTIEGTGINSDGRTTGLSLPSQTAQAALLREVYDTSRVDPSELVYVEAHGTGTAVGDPIEAGALGEVLGRNRTAPLPIGSVKTNVGHLEAGSGMAGLLKAMLVLRDRLIPASLHCDVVNPAIDLAGLNLHLAREAMPVPPTPGRTAVGINSFGFGGTNAHAVLASGPAAAIERASEADALPPLLISARSEAALAELARRWGENLAEIDADAAARLLRGAARAREHHAHRLAATGPTPAALQAALAAQAAGRSVPDLATGAPVPPPREGQGRTAFVYSGNGSQWAGMALDALEDRVFRRAMEEVDAELAPRLGWSVVDRLRAVDDETMRRTDVAQPMLFAIQAASLPALAAVGVVGEAHWGHSVGEVAAALAAGALSLADAAQVIVARSVAQQRTSNAYGMAVLATGAAAAAALLAGMPELEIAAVNSANSITVAGPRTALARLERLAGKQRVGFVALPLDYGFHSAAMDPVRDGLLLDLAGISPAATRAPFYSTVLGARCEGAELGPDYWWRNVRAPVRFADAAAAAIADGHTILVEIGPNPVLLGYLREGLRQADKPGRALATLSRRATGGAPFGRIAAHAFVAGHDISGAASFDGPMELAGLPRYPWQRERFWYERTDEATDTIAARRDHPLLGFRRGDAPDLWHNTLDLALEPWLADHALDGTPLLPAAAIVEMALAAARARHPGAATLDVLDLEIAKPLLLERGVARETRFHVSGERGGFELASRVRLSGDGWTVHATGRIVAGSEAALTAPTPAGGTPHIVDGPELYALTARLGLQYGPAFQTVRRVAVGGGRSATVDLAGPSRAGFLLDPARLDGALQGLVALAARELSMEGGAILPWRMGRVRLGAAGGAIATAELRIDRVGPRSISAEIALRDEAGQVLATLSDCWFARVSGGTADELGTASFHAVSLPQPRAETPGPLAAAPTWTTAPVEPDETALLLEAFVAIAAFQAIEAVAEPGASIAPARLAAEGRVHPEALPLLNAALGWLQRDGLASVTAGEWVLAGAEDLPPAAEIWRSVLSGAPDAVAEAALMGTVAEALPAVLAGGVAALPAGLAALTEHMLTASPTARAAVDALLDAAGAVAAAWPANRPLRVLEVGAVDAAITARLAATLARSGAAIRYVGLLAPGADAAAIEAAAALPGATTVAWDVPAPIDGGGFDLAVGTFALARTGMAAAVDRLGRLGASMTPGGLLLLAEPRPNRVWDLRFGADPAWWRAGGAATPLADGAEWQAILHGSGFVDGTAGALAGTSWDAHLLSARATGARRTGPAPVPAGAGLLLVADSASPLADAVAAGLLAGGRTATRLPTEATRDAIAAAAPAEGDVVVLVPAPMDEAGVTAAIAQAGAMLAGTAVALAETGGLRLWVVVMAPYGHALVAGALRGVTRVLANEAPNLRPIFVEIDPAASRAEAAALLLAELAAPEDEPELALGSDRRAVTRVRRGLGAAAEVAAPGPARLQIGQPGLLDTLGWQPGEARAPGEGEVAIAVAAAGLNFRDVMWSLGLLPDEALMDGLAGATLGLECAGTVTAVGSGVEHVAVGDRVMAIAPACLATNTVAPAAATVRLPDGVGFAAGATVPVAFLTVCYALGTLARLQPGERVLIHGGAGAVGLAAIQYARHCGAEVFATAGSPAKRALLRLLGVDHVLDSRSLAFADEIRAVTGGGGVDVVLNSLAGEAMERSVGVLRPFGRFLELGKRDLYGNTPLGLRALRHNVSYFAIDADQLPVQRPEVAKRVFAEIAALMAADKLRPLPYRLFRFGEVTSAFRLMQSAAHVGKIVLAPEPEGVTVTRPPARWAPNPDGTYVVTGGLSGFGLETARWLVAAGVRSLALLSRQGPGAAAAAGAMAGFAAQGVAARAYACDVADADALAGVLHEIRAGMAPIAGVIHAAMVLDDALLPQLDARRFAAVLGPKLEGAQLLDRLTRPDRLDTFLVFSSVTTTLGNPGQANYVAANAAMEALVAARRAAGRPGLSVGWGPIGDVGILSREQAVSAMLAQRMGAAHLLAREALAHLPVLLASGRAHVDVGRVRWDQLRHHLPHLATPVFAEMLRGAEGETGQVDLAERLKAGSPAEARALVVELLTAEVAAITRTPREQINGDRSLTDLGMDSLMAVELRMALERRFGASLPLLSLADGASIGSIAARMVRHLVAEPAADGTTETADRAELLLARYEVTAEPGEPVSGELAFAELARGIGA